MSNTATEEQNLAFALVAACDVHRVDEMLRQMDPMILAIGAEPYDVLAFVISFLSSVLRAFPEENRDGLARAVAAGAEFATRHISDSVLEEAVATTRRPN
jgi:hypothetical protein